MASEDKKLKKEKLIKKKSDNVRKKKKKWVTIIAPKMFGGKEIGESIVTETEEIKGRSIDLSTSDFGKGRNPSIKLMFKVTEIANGQAMTEIYSYYLLGSFSRRIVRKGKSKIYTSLKLKTKDDINCTIKVVGVTKSKVTGGLLSELKHELDKIVTEEITGNTFEANLNNLIDYKVQKKIKETIKKLYPLVALEVLMFNKN